MPKRKPRPICPMCEQEGVHPSSDDCAAALHREIDVCAQRLTKLHPDVFLQRWTAYGVAQGHCARVASLEP